MKKASWLSSRSIYLIYAAAVCVYAIAALRFYVGDFSDDARDILAARSLLQGGYRDLQLPGNPPAIFPLPGFPFLLAPWVALAGSHLDWLRVVPIAFTVLAGVLLERLLRPYLSPAERWSLTALFLFNPVTLFVANHIIADSAYLFFLLLTALAFSRTIKDPTPAAERMYTAALAAAAVIRPEGIVLLLSFGLVALSLRRSRLSALSLALAPLPWLAFLIRNLAVSNPDYGYFRIWKDGLGALASQPGAFLQHTEALFRALFLQLLTAWPFLLMPFLEELVLIGLVIGGMVLLFLGLRRLGAMQPTPLAPLAALWVYSVGHFILHLAWPAVDPHYLWPMLPILLFLMMWGLRGRARVLTIFLCLTYGVQGIVAVRDGLGREGDRRFPAKTLQAVVTQTQPDAFILSPDAALVTLYTGRHTLAFLGAKNADDFYRRLKATGLTHVLLGPAEFLYVNPHPARFWAAVGKAVPTSPARYTLRFKAPDENRALYEIKG